MNKTQFRQDLEAAINRNSMENGSDTPDFILADYLMDCLDNFDRTVSRRTKWYKPEETSGGDGLAPVDPPHPVTIGSKG
jgi:hypothetical protein